MDLTAVRAELKVWEKAFKAREGRDPSKADIKANPEIAEKYRVYSKSRLDKGTAPPSAVPAPAAPSRTVPITPTKQRVASTSTPTSRGGQADGDIFKTPSRRDGSGSKSANHNNNGATEFAYAPSPSRLRALAASRSFSGSPNRKATSAVEEFEASVAASPKNLGRSFVLPPVADTPRTKARKWLAGDAVSPPVKAKLQANRGAFGSSVPETSSVQVKKKPANGRGNGSFWEQVEREKKDAPHDKDDFDMDASSAPPPPKRSEEDDDFLAPSPVKPVNGKGKGKAKQRQFIDLLGEDVQESTEAEDPLLRKQGSVSTIIAPSTSMKIEKSQVSTSSFFAASSTSAISKPNFASRTSTTTTSTTSSASSTYVPAASKPKKRSSMAAALTPFDRLEEEEHLISAALGSGRSGSATPVFEDKVVREEVKETKRPRREAVKRKVLQIGEDEMEDEHILVNDSTLESGGTGSTEAVEQEEPLDEDYELRDLSDEYEPYKPFSRLRSTTPHLDPNASTKSTRAASATPEIDDSLDPHLVSLLSLKTSPVKNRLAKLHKKREETVSKLLMEPTYLMAQKKEQAKTGLEDLEDDEDLVRGSKRGDEGGDEDDLEQEELEDDEKEEGRAENSDDDWASEPEGWKDLGDGEMDALD